MAKNYWSREELILAINLYCKLSFGQFDHRNREVIRLANHIGRSPSAVAMKLSNFAALDTYHQARGVKGLLNFSQADKRIWEEFTSNWELYGTESERIMEAIETSSAEDIANPLIENIDQTDLSEYSHKQTEAERTVQIRLGQNFFRRTVLTSYDNKCCICGMPIPVLLVASHIIPWRERKDLRLNPHNGLCLCALHDKAFDKGLIGINADNRVVISPNINRYLPNLPLSNSFEFYNTVQIAMPNKFSPKSEFLQFHFQNYFIAS